MLIDIWIDFYVRVFLACWYGPSLVQADTEKVGLTLNGMKNICKT